MIIYKLILPDQLFYGLDLKKATVCFRICLKMQFKKFILFLLRIKNNYYSCHYYTLFFLINIKLQYSKKLNHLYETSLLSFQAFFQVSIPFTDI